MSEIEPRVPENLLDPDRVELVDEATDYLLSHPHAYYADLITIFGITQAEADLIANEPSINRALRNL